jgi:hypothetical protein
MTDTPAAITAEEWATWLTPSQVLDALETSVTRSTAATAIKQQLLDGLLVAVAETVVGREGGVLGRKDYCSIEANSWRQFEHFYATHDFWKTGQITATSTTTRGVSRSISFYGVRFNPNDLRSLFAAVGHPSAEAPVTSSGTVPSIPQQADDDVKERGPAVSQAHLEEWYALYRKVYSGSADTEATAIESATGMFPGKHVARPRIRTLRGPQERGRKPGGD